MSAMPRRPRAATHLKSLRSALAALEDECGRIDRWGERLSDVLVGGGRLLAAGNGGSAAQAQHLTAELVGRYLDERRPLSAISLHADTSSLTAIYNDYGSDECFARQVRAHGRPGDVLVALSTSGESGNVVTAVEVAAELGMQTWGLTGPAPNSVASACHDALSVDADATSTVQESHLVVVHLLCAAVDRHVASSADLAGLREALR